MTERFQQRSFFREVQNYVDTGPKLTRSVRVTPIYHKTVLHAVQHNAKTHPDQVFARWLDKTGEIVNKLTYEELWLRSVTVKSAILRNKKINKGDRVMISYPFGLEFLEGLIGCMLAEVIPCSVYPPNPGKGKEKFSYDQFNTQVKDAGARFALTTKKFCQIMTVARLKGNRANVTWIATDILETVPRRDDHLKEELPTPDDIAFIQYSSGSTSSPKGIVLSHKAVTHNVFTVMSTIVSRKGDGSRTVSWLPQYHDYGLNIFFLSMFTTRLQIFNFSPIDFIKNPLLWADGIDEFKATTIGGPNFAYGLLAKRLKEANRVLKYGSLIERAQIGAEPIAPETLDVMQEIGIPREALMPSYGMAESSVYVSSCVGNEIRVLDGVVSCGFQERTQAFDKDFVIANADGKICSEGEVGEIYIRGPDLANGYWKKPELDHRFHCKLDDGHEYFGSGDLGKVIDQRLYVVGRVKELIIINGKNVYPTDIERLIEKEYPSVVRPGSTVAIQLTDTKIGIVFELRNDIPTEKAIGGESLSRLVRAFSGVQVGKTIALEKHSVPKTTSGKLRRIETRRLTVKEKWPRSSIKWSWAPGGPVCHDRTSSESKPTLTPVVDCETIIKRVIGSQVEMDKTWEDNGLGSMTQIELANSIAEELGVSVPASFADDFKSPNELKSFVNKTSSDGFPFSLVDLNGLRNNRHDRRAFSKSASACIQGTGLVVLFLCFLLSLFTAYFVGRELQSFRREFQVGERFLTWSLIPMVIPVFMTSLSLIVIILKWVIVGKYRSTEVDVMPASSMFLRWWFVDRAIYIWEFWVGQYIVDTRLVWLFYCLMGAKIHPTVKINASLREFDLISIRKGTSINFNMRCRKFGTWTEKDGASLRFRPVEIGSGCVIDGMVSLGASVGDCSKISKHAVVAECAQVPSGIVAEGNPARSGPQYRKDESPNFSVVFEIFKVIWLVAELYMFHVLILVGQLAWKKQLPVSWRYSPLLYWILLILTVSVGSLVMSVLLTRCVLALSRYLSTTNLVRRIVQWICDYHFQISVSLLSYLSSNSKLWNFVLMMHGVDIDLPSAVIVRCFPPSKAHSIHIRESFLSTGVHFDETDGTKTEVINCSIGYEASIGAGVKLVGLVVSPLQRITESNSGDGDVGSTTRAIGWKNHIFLGELFYALEFVFVCCSLIPAFEIFKACVLQSPLKFALPGVAVGFISQAIVWTFSLRLLQALLSVLKPCTKVYDPLYHTYLTYVWSVRSWSFWALLWGSPFFSYLLIFMGAKVDGELLYFGNAIFDFDKLSFRDRTIVDEAFVLGHYQVYSQLTVEPTVVGGVLHQGTFALAGSDLDRGREHGPYRMILKNPKAGGDFVA